MSQEEKPRPAPPAGGPVERDDVRLLRSPHRCPFCHDQVDAAQEQVACRGCLARHHRECWREGGRCAACGATDALVGSAEPGPSSSPLIGIALVGGLALAILTLLGGGVFIALRGAASPGPARPAEPLDLSGPPEEVTARVRARAESGDPAAMNLLGFRLLMGQGCAVDEAEAFRWGLRAAESGHAEAMFGIAGLLEQGRGTRRDEAAAVRWYRRAIASGDTLAGPALERLLSRRPDLR